jgi:hypothetical protein
MLGTLSRTYTRAEKQADVMKSEAVQGGSVKVVYEAPAVVARVDISAGLVPSIS